MRGMRGVSAFAVIIVLAIIGVIAYLALQYLPGGIRTGVPAIAYKNDVITVEDLFVSNLRPYEGTTTDIEFLVSNNGDKAVKNIIVTFESTGGGFTSPNDESKEIFNSKPNTLSDCDEQKLQAAGCPDSERPEKPDLLCPAASRLSCGNSCRNDLGGYIREWNKCVFDKIDSLDAKPVRAQLEGKNVDADTTYNIRYSVQYDYGGSRLATVPVIDGETLRRPISKFSQSTPSYGPVVLEFQAGEPRELTEGGQRVTGYWLEFDRAAEVKISLKNVGSGSVGTINDTYIKTETFTLDTKGTLTPSGFCNFKGNAAKEDGLLYYCRNVVVDKDDPTKCGINAAMRPVKLPAELSCSLTPSERTTVPEFSASILADFEYTYKFTKTQPITVRNIRG